ncbi:MAG: hypothetical protein GWN32_13825 [Gemmatimonadetes bacterium]|nr:hypothetical protein [Gemmatimonadota bacterium]
MLVGGTILVLDSLGVPWGFGYGLVLTAVSGVATLAFIFFIDRGRTITGAAARPSQKVEIKTIPQAAPAHSARIVTEHAPAGD